MMQQLFRAFYFPSQKRCLPLAVVSLKRHRELCCFAGKQPKGTFLIKGYSVRMAPHLRKDSKKESCFELISQDRRSYEVSHPHDPRKPGIFLAAACEPQWLGLWWTPPAVLPAHFSPPALLLLTLLRNAFSSRLLLRTLFLDAAFTCLS